MAAPPRLPRLSSVLSHLDDLFKGIPAYAATYNCAVASADILGLIGRADWITTECRKVITSVPDDDPARQILSAHFFGLYHFLSALNIDLRDALQRPDTAAKLGSIIRELEAAYRAFRPAGGESDASFGGRRPTDPNSTAAEARQRKSHHKDRLGAPIHPGDYVAYEDLVYLVDDTTPTTITVRSLSSSSSTELTVGLQVLGNMLERLSQRQIAALLKKVDT